MGIRPTKRQSGAGGSGVRSCLFIQLPVPGFRWPRVDANVPLAAGYLSAWAEAEGWRFEILPWEEADLLGDEALLRAVLARKPDLVGFSLYLWNSERSLALGRRLREQGVRVAVGGPEVVPENRWVYESGGADFFIPGEGEEPFRRLLAGFPETPVPPLSNECPPIDLAKLPSPYLTGAVPPAPDGTVRLETVRGCPFRCAYCHYGKSFTGIRRFPEGWLEGHLAWCRANGGREVYLMDPSFNVRPDWEETLSALERGNPDGFLHFHTELVADRLRPGDALRLARAGLKSCEVGLQSVHPEVLARVGRRWDREAWLSGMRELAEAGIDAVVGLIAGLPGDTPEGFLTSLAFVRENIPEAGIQVFPLAVLPGTGLAARAREEEIKHLPRPPYTVTETDGMTFEDLRAAFRRFEEETGLEHDAPGVPPLWGPWTGGEDVPYLSGARLLVETAPPDWPKRLADRAALNFTLVAEGWREGFSAELQEFAEKMRHGVLTVVLDAGAGWPLERLDALRQNLPANPYLLRHYAYSPSPALLPRVVVLVRDGEGDEAWLDGVRRRAELILSVEGSGWQRRAEELLEQGETVLVRGGRWPEDAAGWAQRLGPDRLGLLFEAPELQRRWEETLGFEPPEARDFRITLGR